MIDLFRDLFAPPRHLILIIIASWIGLGVSEQRSERHGISKEHLSNTIFYSILALVLGGRLSFVMLYPSAFTKSPFSIFSISPDLFDAPGGIIFTCLFFFIYAFRNQINSWSLLDAITPFLSVTAIGLAASSLAAGTHFGIETDLPWAIILWNAHRHPTQIYTIIASTLILSWVLHKKSIFQSGVTFLIFASLVIFSGITIRPFLIESSPLSTLNRQIISWVALIFIFILIEFRLKEEARP